VLVLDAGGSLFGQALANASEGQVIVDAMNAMGYDAMAVGAAEVERGLDVLLQRAAEARFAVLSCNLVSASDGLPVFAPYLVIERGGRRFGVIGVSEPALAELPGLSGRVLVVDPVEAVGQYLPAVQAQSDVVIVLSHLGFELDTWLAQSVPGIHVIVGGRSRRLLMAPELVGTTVLLQAGYDGEWLGRLDLALDAQGQPTEPRVEIITLGPEVESQPQMLALLDSYVQRLSTPAGTPGG